MQLLLVDPEVLFTDVLGQLLAKEPDFEVIGAVRSGEEALRAAALNPPTVALTALRASRHRRTDDPHRTLKALCPNVGIVIVADSATPDVTHRAMDAGAAGFVGKEQAADDLIGPRSDPSPAGTSHWRIGAGCRVTAAGLRAPRTRIDERPRRAHASRGRPTSPRVHRDLESPDRHRDVSQRAHGARISEERLRQTRRALEAPGRHARSQRRADPDADRRVGQRRRAARLRKHAQFGTGFSLTVPR